MDQSELLFNREWEGNTYETVRKPLILKVFYMYWVQDSLVMNSIHMKLSKNLYVFLNYIIALKAIRAGLSLLFLLPMK